MQLRPSIWRAGAVAALVTLALPGAAPGAASGALPSAQRASVAATSPAVVRQVDGPPLKVATKPIAPFIFFETEAADEPPTGYSADLWNRVAAELGRSTVWVRKQKVGEVVDAVAASEVDVGIAAISMTAEREARIDYTYPYFDSGLQVMVSSKAGDVSVLSAFSWVASKSFLIALLMFFALVVVFGHLIWLIERKENEDFPHGYGRGIFHGMFWALAVITGGDSEKSVSRPLGRVIFALWLLFGIFLVAYVTGLVTTDLTVNSLQGSIESIDDVAGKNVVCVPDTVAAKFLESRGIRYTPVKDAVAAVDAVANRNADATVYDSPVLAYAAATQAKGRVEVVGPIFRPDKYGIALPTNSALREEIDDILLRLQADGTLDDLYRKWFQSE